MVGRDDAKVDVRGTTLVPDRARPLEAEPARAVGDDRRAAGADVLPQPIRLPEMDPRSGQRAAVDGGEDDPGQDVAGADLRPPRRRAAAERAGAVVQRRPAAGRRRRGRAGAGGAETEDDETGGGREQPHALRSSRPRRRGRTAACRGHEEGHGRTAFATVGAWLPMPNRETPRPSVAPTATSRSPPS